ncbi:hypothetical protein Tco_0485202 [Tanacetum coccineum]
MVSKTISLTNMNANKLLMSVQETAALSITKDGVRGITATIDRKGKVFVSEASTRRHLKLEDSEAEEDPFNQGRSLIEELDLDAGISLVPPHDADQGRFDATPISDQPEEQLGDFSVATALADATRRSRSVENFKLTPEEVEKLVLAVVELVLPVDYKEEHVSVSKESRWIQESHFQGMGYEDIRPIFERVWDQNQAFIPMGSEIEKEVMKRL